MLDEFDNIEMKVESDLDVETKNEMVTGENQKPEISKLDKETEEDKKTKVLENVKKQAEIDAKNNAKNFAKSQKPKKSLKKRVLAWVLGAGIFAGAAAGATIGIKNYVEDQTTGDGAYQKAIRSRYERVDKTLTERLRLDTAELYSYGSTKITQLRFEEPGNEDVVLNIYTDLVGENYASGNTLNHTGHTIYKVLIDYYNTLVDAENANNMISYLDALNEIFENMQFESHSTNRKIDLDLASLGKNAGQKLSELFALDVEKEGVVKQIGFLPYRIEVTKWEPDGENGLFHYSFAISGISYCETTFESSDLMPTDEQLISNKDVASANIKTYNRTIEISSSLPFVDYEKKEKTLANELKKYVNGTKSDFDVKTTCFEETNIYDAMKDFMSMREGNFDYKKPENVDMNLVK